jgi:hypothetical protein
VTALRTIGLYLAPDLYQTLLHYIFDELVLRL